MAQEAPASVLCVCLGAKLFARHLKSAHPPPSAPPTPTQLPPLKLVCRQWNANKSRWRNFSKMPRRASIYGRQVEILSQAEDQRWREEGQSVGCRGRGSQPRAAAGQSYQHLLLLLLLLLSRAVSCQNCMFIAWFLALAPSLSPPLPV